MKLVLEHNDWLIPIQALSIRDNDIDIEDPNTMIVYDDGTVSSYYDISNSTVGAGVVGCILINELYYCQLINEDYTLRVRQGSNTMTFRIIDLCIVNSIKQPPPDETIAITFTAKQISLTTLSTSSSSNSEKEEN